MSRLVEWLEDTIDSLDAGDIIVGIGIGVIIFCVLLLVVISFSILGPVVLAALFVFVLCVGAGILIVGSL